MRKARRAAARRGRRLRIMFTDEARFGRMNRIGPCWAPIGTRPAVAAQLIREYIYLYGAVAPKDGTCVYLIMPTSNTACFQVFLDVLARKFARQDILLVLDGAPNHRCGDLVVPDNVMLLYLPPNAIMPGTCAIPGTAPPLRSLPYASCSTMRVGNGNRAEKDCASTCVSRAANRPRSCTMPPMR